MGVKLANGLTIKQENFALALAELGNASQAYRRAYNTANMQPKTVWEHACVLAKHAKVKARLRELRSQVAELSIVDKAWLTQQLADNAELAKQLKQLALA